MANRLENTTLTGRAKSAKRQQTPRAVVRHRNRFTQKDVFAIEPISCYCGLRDNLQSGGKNNTESALYFKRDLDQPDLILCASLGSSPDSKPAMTTSALCRSIWVSLRQLSFISLAMMTTVLVSFVCSARKRSAAEAKKPQMSVF